MAAELVAQEDADLLTQCIDRWNDDGGSMACHTNSEATVSTYGLATHRRLLNRHRLFVGHSPRKRKPGDGGNRRHRSRASP